MGPESPTAGAAAVTVPPPWFTGPPPRIDPRERSCRRCGAPPGETCRYTSGYQVHRDPATGGYVDNVIGQPMLRSHAERYQP